MTKDNEERTQRTNEVIAEMAAQLARDGVDDNRIKFLLKHGVITSSAAAEAYIRSGIGRVPAREILEQVKSSEAGKLALAKQDAPQPEPAPDLSKMSPAQRLAYARASKPDTKK